MRALCFVDGDHLRVQSYNERDVTVSWPELAGLPDALPGRHRAARRRAGRHRRRRSAELRAAAAAHARDRPGRGRPPIGGGAGGLRGLRPAAPRRPRPHRAAPDRPSPAARPGRSIPARAGAARRSTTTAPPCSRPPTERGLEGVVAKRLDSRYEPGKRTRTWLKVKVRLRQEMVVGGWLPGRGQPHRPHRRAARRLPRPSPATACCASPAGSAPGFKDAELAAARPAVRGPRHRRVPLRPAAAPRRDPARAPLAPPRAGGRARVRRVDRRRPPPAPELPRPAQRQAGRAR